MKKRILGISVLVLASLITIYYVGCNSSKDGGNNPTVVISDTLSQPPPGYLIPLDSLPYYSQGKAADSIKSLAAETINRQSLINFLQSMDSTNTNVTFQFLQDSLGYKHIAVYSSKAHPDTVLIYSAFPIKCPPTCGAYSSTGLTGVDGR